MTTKTRAAVILDDRVTSKTPRVAWLWSALIPIKGAQTRLQL
jgi:hypothetical protein